jgi:Thrombospondin type 3 repeat/RTX calcium-binding nonapeptide repeat (4 copies)
VRRAVLLAAVLALAAPASAGAHSLVRPAGDVVSYLSADATSLNDLTVRSSGNRIEFRDPSVEGGMDPGSCTPGELSYQSWIIQTFCPLAGVRRVRIDLGDREDSANVALPIAASVLGGSGADRLIAGQANDELSGGEGNDIVLAGPGDDVVDGGPGGDEVDGGPGSDRLGVRDGVLDIVRCGEGADTVDADTLDRTAADCESVTRTGTAAPADGGADDGRPPRVEVGAPTLQRLGRSRRVRVYATSSERGTVSASGFLDVAGLALPVKRVPPRRVSVAGGGAALEYRLAGNHWRLVRRALRRGRRVSVRLGVVATDLAGQSTRRNAPRITLELAAGPRGRARAARHPEPGDVDGDEVPDVTDNCVTVKNGSQLDTDRDGQGDACDADDDADGVPDTSDNCRLVRNQDQVDGDGDGYGDACPPVDDDADGLINDDDNCDPVPNPDQSDLDGDDRGDACDRDDDGDRFDDEFDNCPTVYNLEATDIDGDGFVNDQLDRDGDGVGTACDADEPAIQVPTGPGGRLDRRRPRLWVGVGRRHELAAVRAGLVVPLRCSEACGASVELVIDRRTARRLGLGRTRVLAGGSARLQGRGTTYAFARFDARARRALFRRRSVRATLTAVAVDGSGNRRSHSRRIVLAR